MSADSVDEGEQQASTRQCRHPFAKDFGVQRMRQGYLLTAAVGADSEQAGVVDLLERLDADGIFELAYPDRLYEREQRQELVGGDGYGSQTRVDELGQSCCMEERARQSPDAFGLDETTTGPRAEHELAYEQNVSLGDLGHGLDRRALDGTAEREVEECVDSISREVAEVDAEHVVAAPEFGHRVDCVFPGADCSHEEDGVRVDQLPEERGGRRVESMQIVDEEHEGVVAGAFRKASATVV